MPTIGGGGCEGLWPGDPGVCRGCGENIVPEEEEAHTRAAGNFCACISYRGQSFIERLRASDVTEKDIAREGSLPGREETFLARVTGNPGGYGRVSEGGGEQELRHFAACRHGGFTNHTGNITWLR